MYDSVSVVNFIITYIFFVFIGLKALSGDWHVVHRAHGRIAN